MPSKEELIVAFARSLVGKAKWRHRGRKPWAVDCVGLVVLSLRAADISIEDEAGYGREPWDDRMQKTMRARFGEPVKDWKAGDIALIKAGRKDPTHCAILADHPDGGLSIIHVSPVKGVAEQGARGPYLEWIQEVYRA